MAQIHGPGSSVETDARHGDSPPSAVAPDVTTITKYLCAAAYLDEDFASTVVSQVLDERHRFVAPSYGVDLPTVVRHCVAAQRRQLALQGVLAALIVLATLRFLMGAGLGQAFVLFVVAWACVFGETYFRRHVIVARRIAKEDLDLDDSSADDARYEERLSHLATDQHEGNVIVYSGFSPFVGSGTAVQGWSFVLDLARRLDVGVAQDGASPDGAAHGAVPDGALAPGALPSSAFSDRSAHGGTRPVDVVELHDYVADGLRKLDLAGLAVEDRLFVNGQEIRDDRRFLPDPRSRPVTQVEPTIVRSYVGRQTRSVRGYLCARVVDWRGELVVSVYLRFLSVSGNLFAEASYYLLPGLKRGYHSVEALNPEPTVRQVTRLLRESGRRTPRASVKAVPAVGAWLISPFQRRSSERATERALRENPAFDYGARASIRELAMSSSFRRYFQEVDKEMYLKLLEHRILDLVVQFLENHNVDTAELRERRNVIVNHGVMVTGNGSIQADSLAAGQGATSTVRRVVDGVQRAATGGADG